MLRIIIGQRFISRCLSPTSEQIQHNCVLSFFKGELSAWKERAYPVQPINMCPCYISLHLTLAFRRCQLCTIEKKMGAWRCFLFSFFRFYSKNIRSHLLLLVNVFLGNFRKVSFNFTIIIINVIFLNDVKIILYPFWLWSRL